MVLVPLLVAAVWAALAAWFAGQKGLLPYDHRKLWQRATAPLRARSELLPALVFVGGWITLWFFALLTSATVTLLVLTLFVPYLLLDEYGRGVVGFAIGLARAVVNEISGSETMIGPDEFGLPVDVRKSKADDVGTWDSLVAVPRRSLLTLGASGSGKSETLKHFVEQLSIHPDEPVVVFDMKTDYQDFLAERDVPMLRLSAEGSMTEIGSPIAWNIFEEMETEADADEIARALFPKQKHGEDNFFATAARQLFAANLKYLRREMENPTNADLVRYWERADPDKMYENLTRDGHEDLTSAAAAIDPDAGRQAAGVFATAQQQVSDLFVGDFAGEGQFSIRQYMQEPQGRVLVLDYPSRQSETIAPLFRFLLDDAIKHGMDDPQRQAFFLLDEIEHLGVSLSRIGELINVGRGVNCQAIISLQSVAQLQDTYGKERANALLSGMHSSVILRLNDSPSVEYARETIGTHFEEYTGHVEKRPTLFGNGMVETERETRLSEEHDFAKGEFRSFQPGEAVICRQGEGWVHGRIQLLES